MAFGSPELAKSAIQSEREALAVVKAQRAAATTQEQATALDQWVAVQEQRLSDTVAHAKQDLQIVQAAAPELLPTQEQLVAQINNKRIIEYKTARAARIAQTKAEREAAAQALAQAKAQAKAQAAAVQELQKNNPLSVAVAPVSAEFKPSDQSEPVAQLDTTAPRGDVISKDTPAVPPAEAHYVPPAGQAANWTPQPEPFSKPAEPAVQVSLPATPVEAEAEAIEAALEHVTSKPFPYWKAAAILGAGVLLFWGYKTYASRSV